MEKGYAVVTGGSRGIGAALCEQLAKEGYDVLVNYSSSPDRAEEVATKISSTYGIKALTFKASVNNYDEVKAMRDFALKEFGEKLTVLVNNAGLTNMKPLVELTREDYERVIGVDLLGTLHCCHLLGPLMIKQNFGKMVTIASTAGLEGQVGMADYCAAKAGQIGLNRSLALEWGKYNITCNVIAPGFVATEGTAQFGQELEDRIRALSPIGQISHVEDMQHTFSYLINSKVMTGQVLAPNCGQFMH